MPSAGVQTCRSEEHTSELQSHDNLVCRLLLEKKKQSTFPHGRFPSSTPTRSSLLASTALRPRAGLVARAGEGVGSRFAGNSAFFFFLIFRRPPKSPLFPYTTLFR